MPIAPVSDRSLEVMAEMMMRARFEPAAVAAERPVILSEKNRRPELTQRFFETSWPLVYAGLRYVQRDPIGTEATLNGATAEGLRAFYRRWYRPERATMILVGDADPAMLEELVRTRFGGWQGDGPNPADPDFGRPAEPASPVAALAYPGVPVTATATWVRPYEAEPHTIARERQYLEDMLATRIINRRLEAHARGESAFIGASLAPTRQREAANLTSLSVTARDGRWREGLTEAFAIIGDALRAPPSAAEIDRELRNIRTAATAAVQGEATALSQLHAERLASAIDGRAVVATAQTTLDNFERNVPEMTPERIESAMDRLFVGSGPRLLVTAPEPIAATARRRLAAARAAAPATRAAERLVSFDDLPALGRPGRETSRRVIADMGVTIVRFANGSTLTHSAPNSSAARSRCNALRLRPAGLAPDRPSFGWLSPLVAPRDWPGSIRTAWSGCSTGRRINLAFGIDEDAFVLSGQTSATDLRTSSGYSPPSWSTHAGIRPSSPASARARSTATTCNSLRLGPRGGELGGVIRPATAAGGRSSGPTSRRRRPRRWSALMRRCWRRGRCTRSSSRRRSGGGDRGDAEHRGRAAAPDRARPGGLPTASARAQPGAGPLHPSRRPQPGLCADRLDDAGRPRPHARTAGAESRRQHPPDPLVRPAARGGGRNLFAERRLSRRRELPGLGHRLRRRRDRPQRTETFFRVAREIVADLAARPASAEEFARAQNPVISGIERRLASNGYWLQALENWERDERDIENVRNYLSDYRALTAEDVRRAVATWVTDQGDWSMLVLPAREQAARSE